MIQFWFGIHIHIHIHILWHEIAPSTKTTSEQKHHISLWNKYLNQEVSQFIYVTIYLINTEHDLNINIKMFNHVWVNTVGKQLNMLLWMKLMKQIFTNFLKSMQQRPRYPCFLSLPVLSMHKAKHRILCFPWSTWKAFFIVPSVPHKWLVARSLIFG